MKKKTKTEKLVEDISGVLDQYDKLTVRQAYYRLVTKGYPNNLRFYKRLIYHLTKMRRVDDSLNWKFVDTTRELISPSNAYDKGELWVEKDSIRQLLEEFAYKYKVRLQMQRGFASMTMLRDAIQRCKQRGVETILYVGDFDPSGLCIEAVSGREIGMTLSRIALTQNQIKNYNLPGQPVKKKDSRAKDYIKKFGNICYEVESLEPNLLCDIVEDNLKILVPEDYLKDTEIQETAGVMAYRTVKDITDELTKAAYKMLKAGKTKEDVQLDLEKMLPLIIEKRKK